MDSEIDSSDPMFGVRKFDGGVSGDMIELDDVAHPAQHANQTMNTIGPDNNLRHSDENVSAQKQVDCNSRIEACLRKKFVEVIQKHRQYDANELLEYLNSSTLFQECERLKGSLCAVLDVDPFFDEIPAQFKKAICGEFVLSNYTQVLEAVNETLASSGSAPDVRAFSRFTTLVVTEPEQLLQQPVLYNDAQQGFERRKAEYVKQFVEKFGVLPKKSLGEYYQFDDWIKEKWGEHQDNGTLNSKLISVIDPDLLKAGYDFMDAMALRVARAQKAGKKVERPYAKLKDCLSQHRFSSEKKRVLLNEG